MENISNQFLNIIRNISQILGFSHDMNVYFIIHVHFDENGHVYYTYRYYFLSMFIYFVLYYL